MTDRARRALWLLESIPTAPETICKKDLADKLGISMVKLNCLLYSFTWMLPIAEDGKLVTVISEDDRQRAIRNCRHNILTTPERIC